MKKKEMDKNKFSRKLLIKPRFLKGIEWLDRCDTLIHFMFEHLCLYMEQESHNVQWFTDDKVYNENLAKIGTDEEWQVSSKEIMDDERSAKKEMDFLYVWWTEARPVYYGASPFTDAFFKKHPTYDPYKELGKCKISKTRKQYLEASKKDMAYDEWCLNTDKEMMKRLVDIKEYLWS